MEFLIIFCILETHSYLKFNFSTADKKEKEAQEKKKKTENKKNDNAFTKQKRKFKGIEFDRKDYYKEYLVLANFKCKFSNPFLRKVRIKMNFCSMKLNTFTSLKTD